MCFLDVSFLQLQPESRLERKWIEKCYFKVVLSYVVSRLPQVQGHSVSVFDTGWCRYTKTHRNGFDREKNEIQKTGGLVHLAWSVPQLQDLLWMVKPFSRDLIGHKVVLSYVWIRYLQHNSIRAQYKLCYVHHSCNPENPGLNLKVTSLTTTPAS